MNFDFMTIYLLIAFIYTALALTFLIIDDIGFNPLIIGIISGIVGIFLGWFLFPLLLFYNLVIRKTFI